MKPGYETWVRRHFSTGTALILQPWLDITREYGLVAHLSTSGETTVLGVTQPKNNLTGTVQGHHIGFPSDTSHVRELEQLARKIGDRLVQEGYTGPFGHAALAQRHGFHPLLEINARYTMGFFVLEIEKKLHTHPPRIISLQKPGLDFGS